MDSELFFDDDVDIFTEEMEIEKRSLDEIKNIDRIWRLFLDVKQRLYEHFYDGCILSKMTFDNLYDLYQQKNTIVVRNDKKMKKWTKRHLHAIYSIYNDFFSNLCDIDRFYVFVFHNSDLCCFCV